MEQKPNQSFAKIRITGFEFPDKRKIPNSASGTHQFFVGRWQFMEWINVD